MKTFNILMICGLFMLNNVSIAFANPTFSGEHRLNQHMLEKTHFTNQAKSCKPTDPSACS
ncbi:MAG: hypothetical protein KBD36_04865 [Alphaproteobacteria bacterium]|nr:hypothetical protein [Alphaproteobacteria bacterium]MBP9777157.1 hypothetical protein [Alphaproteobacteria bacterium]